MKMYVSQDIRKVVKKGYPNIITDKVFVIDTPAIMDELNQEQGNLDKLDKYLFTKAIDKKLQMVYHSKRYRDVLYLVDKLDEKFIFSIQNYLKDNDIYITDFILLDYTVSLNHKIYQCFSNVF